MNAPNFYLKGFLIQRDGSIVAAARALEMREDRLSRVIHRRVKPSPEEKRRISWHLQRSISELFGDNDNNQERAKV